METSTAMLAQKKTNVRWMIVAVLFMITAINYADRATISLAGPEMAKELKFNSVTMGYIFSAFGWSYVIAQLPGGWLLDKFGSKIIYSFSIFFWSLFTLLTGTVGFLSGLSAVVLLFALRFFVGASEAPSFPANSRIVAAWFPKDERGTASAIFNSAQYAATVIFAPLMGWLIHTFSWHYVFTVMGVLGILFVFVWNKMIYDPKDHPMANDEEVAYIEEGGGLVSMDMHMKSGAPTEGPKLQYVGQLLKNRMMVGIYLAQYCINALTYFFITWFPVYLVKEKHMTILKAGFVAAIPAVCGFIGGVLGGVLSDAMLRRGYSLTVARKTPIVLGMLLSMTMVFCNYVELESAVIFFMALAFFGKGIGALGWAVNSDTAPKQIAGLSGGLLNVCGNISSITTPIAIGYIIESTGSFNGALVYVGVHAFIAMACYLFVVGEIKRVELK
ncbi:MFS transporter [Uliginosibacterium gangwonense]|uniref:MFS transporter n=1 Tax=Uliginosibacterium gangwonense TaxID=392736 RepID=UPI0003691697|nr:MFS transporter [Uliginosibacterium gangwonense]